MHNRVCFSGYWKLEASYVACEKGDVSQSKFPIEFMVIIDIQQTPFEIQFESGP